MRLKNLVIMLSIFLSNQFAYAETINNSSDNNSQKENASGSAVVSNTTLDNTIDVGSPGIKKIRIAIPDFVLTEANLNITSNEVTKLKKPTPKINTLQTASHTVN